MLALHKTSICQFYTCYPAVMCLFLIHVRFLIGTDLHRFHLCAKMDMGTSFLKFPFQTADNI